MSTREFFRLLPCEGVVAISFSSACENWPLRDQDRCSLAWPAAAPPSVEVGVRCPLAGMLWLLMYGLLEPAEGLLDGIPPVPAPPLRVLLTPSSTA